MRTAELTGALLDYWVAKSEGMEPYYYSNHEDALVWMRHGRFSSAIKTPRYSTDWSQGGPIIDRDQIFLQPPSEVHSYGGPNHGWRRYDHWQATVSARTRTLPPKNALQEQLQTRGVGRGAGETPLLAAMRAKVASHYGDEVPDDRATILAAQGAKS